MSVSSEAEHDWQCWHPAALAQRLQSVRAPWCVVGGWALDLWHGRQTREHDDLEFTVLRADMPVFRQALSGMSFHAVNDGSVDLLAMDEAPADDVFQVWCLEDGASLWRADMMVEPGTVSDWAYKRDPGLVRPRAEMVGVDAAGIPYLKPAGVLLFKAKYQRPKDEQDFMLAVPAMPAAERAWLKAALQRLYPWHEWLGAL